MSQDRSSTDPEELALRAAQGIFDAEVLRWLQSSFTAYFRAGEGMQMERSFDMLTTPGRRRRRQRNYWLSVVAKELANGSHMPLPRAVHDELDRFLTRGRWYRWRSLAKPPEGIAKLNLALLKFAWANDGKGLSVSRIEQLLPPNIFSKKFRADANRLQAMDSPNPQPLEE